MVKFGQVLLFDYMPIIFYKLSLFSHVHKVIHNKVYILHDIFCYSIFVTANKSVKNTFFTFRTETQLIRSTHKSLCKINWNRK